MKLSGKQALNNFVCAATLTNLCRSSIFASARIRRSKHMHQAPQEEGYDPTAPHERRSSNTIIQSRFQRKDQNYLNRPSSESIEKTLYIAPLTSEEKPPSTILKNVTRIKSTAGAAAPPNANKTGFYKVVDVGVLSAMVDTGSSQNDLVSSMNGFDTKKNAREKTPNQFMKKPFPASTCMMGFEKDQLMPANTYINNKIESGTFETSKILFDETSNTVFCNQENDAGNDEIRRDGHGHHQYGCAHMHFYGCETVKCNGMQSCIGATIEAATTIECEGYESCKDSFLDASNTVDCGGEMACFGANIGSKQHVAHLDCHSGESACAYATTASVGSVFCTGPLSCYGSELLGVTESATCQGVPHPHNFYMPTCGGGDTGAISAAPGQSIDVICDGDFACIGNGLNDKNRPTYFDIDVGKDGRLTCGGSLVGNQDGFTFVCRYVDIMQGCSSFECAPPSFAAATSSDRGGFDGIDNNELKNCEYVIGLIHDELCTDEDNNDEDNEDDDDKHEYEYVEEGEEKDDDYEYEYVVEDEDEEDEDSDNSDGKDNGNGHGHGSDGVDDIVGKR